MQLTAAVCCYLNSITDILYICQQLFFTVGETYKFLYKYSSLFTKKGKEFLLYICVFCARPMLCFKQVFKNIFANSKKYAILFDLCFLSTLIPYEKSKAQHIYDFLAFYRLRNRFFAPSRGRIYIYVIYVGGCL